MLQRKLIICFLMLFKMSFGAIEKNDNSFAKNNQVEQKSSMNWEIVYKDEKILIEASKLIFESKADGISHERIVFRYSNISTSKVSFTFNRTATYNGKCYGCESNDKKFSITLEASETREYSEINKDKTFYLFSKDLKGSIKKTLDSYQIINIEKN